jgi:uncharacterized membrane protein
MEMERAMGRYIVCVFDGDRSVYDAARAVQQLDDEGSIAVYEAAIISKDAGGEVQVEDAGEDMPFGTGTGMLLGGLLGLLMDADVAGVDDDFLDTITRKLEPGNFALIAEISEGWTVPLDTRIEELGGTIHRGWRVDVDDERLSRDVEVTRRELGQLEAEWSRAPGDDKKSIQKKMDKVRDRLKSLEKKTDQRLTTLEKETEMRLKKLDEQIAKADADTKPRFEAARAEIQADHDRRAAKLKGANEQAAEV